MKKNAVSDDQLTLFDVHGGVFFRFELDAKSAGSVPGRFDVGAMRVVLSHPPSDCKHALGMVVECLRKLQQTQWKRVRSHNGHIAPVALETWSGYRCIVMFRHVRDDGSVRAWLGKAGEIQFSFPHSTMWKKHGLSWLASGYFCCEEKSNCPN